MSDLTEYCVIVPDSYHHTYCGKEGQAVWWCSLSDYITKTHKIEDYSVCPGCVAVIPELAWLAHTDL